MPDSGGAAGFLGIAPTPAPPTTLLDFFESVPFSTRTADLLHAPASPRRPSLRSAR
ncbi:MAG TPA: hypothetical protein VHI71_06485 [Actinomycetota bacterium]|nr:hypothetical protein [Actinomycetota bacterium]